MRGDQPAQLRTVLYNDEYRYLYLVEEALARGFVQLLACHHFVTFPLIGKCEPEFSPCPRHKGTEQSYCYKEVYEERKEVIVTHINRSTTLSTEATMPYKKLILKAVEDLRDSHMRSSLDAIYRYVESNLPNGIECNYPLFLTDLKAMAEEGDLELTTAYCGLTPEFKKRRVSDIQKRALKLQSNFPDISVLMDVTSSPTQRSGNHMKNKEAKRRVPGRYPW